MRSSSTVKVKEVILLLFIKLITHTIIHDIIPNLKKGPKFNAE
jgi:hypothetical protein